MGKKDNMNKYKIMLIDDDLKTRWENLSAFFTNTILDNCEKIKETEKGYYSKKLVVEFDIVMPQKSEFLDEFIKKNKVDAYVLDVLYEEAGWEKCKLQNILGYIRVHNPQAPIFVYSLDWQSKAILHEVSSAFRNGFPGKMVSYYYDLKEINEIVLDFINSGKEEDLDRVIHERNFIREVIARHQGRTIKIPKSQEGDVSILHISDIQYGDKNTTEYKVGLWKEIVRTCKKMQRDQRIAGIDLLAITGDITMHGRRKERVEAERDLCTLFEDLWEDEYENGSYKERILLVPGNHDYDLNYCVMDYLGVENKNGSREIDFDKIIENLKSRKKMNDSNYTSEGFAEFRKFAYEITGNDFFLSSANLNYVEKRFKDWNLRFICLNTADGIRAEKTNGVKLFGEDYCNQIIRSEDWDDDIFTIALSHHTPTFKTKLEGEEQSKFSIACNSIMQTCGIRLWLGGHRHLHGRKEEVDKIYPCTICESATVRLEEKWADEDAYKVNTEKGEITSHRGFQIINLKKQQSGFKVEITKFVFNEFGGALEVKH